MTAAPRRFWGVTAAVAIVLAVAAVLLPVGPVVLVVRLLFAAGCGLIAGAAASAVG